MEHWFTATQSFTPRDEEKWNSYISWSGLRQLDEVVSLDPMICPRILATIKDEYWSHIVNEDFMLDYFVDLDFLLKQLVDLRNVNLLCVCRNPPTPVTSFRGKIEFDFLGYDLVDKEGFASALTNCGGFPDAFENSELSTKGLLTSHARAFEVQANLHAKYPENHHADCHVWSISRAVTAETLDLRNWR